MSANFPWARLPKQDDLDLFGQRMVKALRLVASMKNNTHCVAGQMVELLGDAPSVRRFMLVAHAVASVWPEPVSVCPTCCNTVTQDEFLIAELLATSCVDDRPRFDHASQDFLNDEARNHLYVAMRHFLDALQPVDL